MHCYCRCYQDVDFEVQGLVDHKEYLFRVAAANANGAGDWLEMPSSIIAKMPFGKLTNFLVFFLFWFNVYSTCNITTENNYRATIGLPLSSNL